MILPGLVSITFRQLSPTEIVELVARTGLTGIEWGSDVHVPHGNLAKAREVKKLTEDAGLQIAAYGSYYQCGHEKSGPFETILETAHKLGAPMIRVWAGSRGAADSDEEYRKQVIDDSRRIAELAAEVNIQIASEWHVNTLTDTKESGKKMLKSIGHNNFFTYWQPQQFMSVERCLEALEATKPWLRAIHVFSWHPETGERLPLADLKDNWKFYLSKADCAEEMFALLEFVQNDDPKAFLSDAETLKSLLKELTLL